MISIINQINLISTCELGCLNNEISYSYKIYSSDLSDLNNTKWNELDINSYSNYFTSVTTDTIRISKYFFSDFPSIKYLKLESFLKNSFKNGSNSIILRINNPPKNGICQINPKIGKAMNENFKIQCSNWTDSDGLITSYKYYGNYNLN